MANGEGSSGAPRGGENGESTQGYVTTEQGKRVAQQIGAREYKECSALKVEGVDDVFEAATRASMLIRDQGRGGHSHHGGGGKSGKGRRREEDAGGCCVVV